MGVEGVTKAKGSLGRWYGDLVYATNRDKRHSVRLGKDRGSGWVGVEEDPNVEIEGNEDIGPGSDTRDDGEHEDDGGVGSMGDTMDPLGSSGMPCRPISDLPIGMSSGGGGDGHAYVREG